MTADSVVAIVNLRDNHRDHLALGARQIGLAVHDLGVQGDSGMEDARPHALDLENVEATIR